MMSLLVAIQAPTLHPECALCPGGVLRTTEAGQEGRETLKGSSLELFRV